MKVIVKLWYEESLVGEPILAEVVKRFDVMTNINRANLEDDLGWVICTLDGDEASISEATEWLKAIGVEVEMLDAGGGVV